MIVALQLHRMLEECILICLFGSGIVAVQLSGILNSDVFASCEMVVALQLMRVSWVFQYLQWPNAVSQSRGQLGASANSNIP